MRRRLRVVLHLVADAAGIVQKLGRNVSGLKVGDRVFVTSTNSGSYAQFVVSDDTFVFPLHERLSFAQVRYLRYPIAVFRSGSSPFSGSDFFSESGSAENPDPIRSGTVKKRSKTLVEENVLRYRRRG